MTREKFCQYVAALIGLSIVTPAMFMLLDRRDPAIIQTAYIEPYDVRPGQEVEIIMTLDVVIPRCEGQVFRKVIDRSGKETLFKGDAVVFESGHVGKGEPFKKKFIIPEGLLPGPAVYDPTVYRWCNILQKTIWPIHSKSLKVPFNVIGETK